MLYNLIRRLARIATDQFFGQIHITGSPAEEDGPLLIVANHPAVMLDGLLVLASYRRTVWFIAKATIFRPGVRSLLRALHFVPVQRRQDAKGSMDQNERSFRFICDALHQGEALLIFPEGQSKAMRQILPVKTGAARIAFQAEEEQDFHLGLRIQAVGLTYSDFQRFRSSVTVSLGSPICVSDYEQQFKDNPIEAVRELSERIQLDLRELTAEVYDEAHVPLVERINKLYRSKGYGADDRERMRTVADNVHRLQPLMPQYAARMERRLTLYLQLASAFRLDASEDFIPEQNPFVMGIICPLVLLGVFVNYPVYRLVSAIGRVFAHGQKSQLASYGLAAAFFLFPAWYLLLASLWGCWQGSWLSGLILFTVLCAAGWSVARYLHAVSLFLFSTFWPARHSPVDLIRVMRDSLIEELESLRSEGS